MFDFGTFDFGTYDIGTYDFGTYLFGTYPFGSYHFGHLSIKVGILFQSVSSLNLLAQKLSKLSRDSLRRRNRHGGQQQDLRSWGRL